jgi:hypothetical protein
MAALAVSALGCTPTQPPPRAAIAPTFSYAQDAEARDAVALWADTAEGAADRVAVSNAE